eukprot:2933318-Prorocentrum_lima.AAC.1
MTALPFRASNSSSDKSAQLACRDCASLAMPEDLALHPQAAVERIVETTATVDPSFVPWSGT